MPDRGAWWIVVGLGLGAAILWSGRYREGPALVALPAAMQTMGLVEVRADGAYVRRAGTVSATFDMQLGRALFVVAARATRVAGKWPRLILTANGDHVSEWRIESDDTRLYTSSVFVAPGPVRFRLQAVDYFEDLSSGENRGVAVERISVVQGHAASALTRRGQMTPADLAAVVAAASGQSHE